MHHKDKNPVHGAEDEDHSVEDVVVSMHFNNPKDKAQQNHSKLLFNKCKVNRDKWETISAGAARVLDIGQMSVHHIVKVNVEDVVDRISEDGMDEVDKVVILRNEDEEETRQ